MRQRRLDRPEGRYWIPVKDGNLTAFEIFKRHYTYRKGRHPTPKITGPGQYICLVNRWATALFIWRKFIDKSGQQGINCAVFRNESEARSSWMILEAEALAWARWPGARLYTYVNARKVKSSNPGYCFKMAGWNPCGFSKKKHLLILEKLQPSEAQ